MRALMLPGLRPNRHWTDEETAACRLGDFEDRLRPNTVGALVGLVFMALGLAVLAVVLTILLFTF